MTLKLYELSEGIKTLVALMEEGDEGWDAALAELTGNFQDKAVNLAKLVKIWEAEEEAYKTEIARLQAHAKAAQGKQAWAKDYLKRNMGEAGIDHVKGDVVDIRLQPSPASVDVPLDGMGGIVPIKFLNGTLTLPLEEILKYGLEMHAKIAVDKRAILEEFKATGEAIPGVTIVEDKHIRIR